jgi:signal transduction histidine kinase
LLNVHWLYSTSESRKRRARALAIAKAEADKANAAKSEFLSRMSHDIRIPLNVVIGSSTLALKEPNSPTTQRYLSDIDQSGKFLLSLVNDLLDLSKIESSRLYFQSAPMNPVRELEDSVAMIRSTSNQKTHKITLKFESEFPERISSDPVRFRQVVLNLLANAVKFTSEGEIEVRAQVQRVEGDNKSSIKITVTDTGMGMDSMIRKNLFKPFMRGENPEVQRVPGSVPDPENQTIHLHHHPNHHSNHHLLHVNFAHKSLQNCVHLPPHLIG